MNLPPLPLVDGALLIDASTLEKYTTCRRSYEYYALEKRELAELRMPLVFGDAVHKALEVRYAYNMDAIEPGFSIVEQAMKDRLTACLRDVIVPMDDHRTIGYGHDLITAYCHHEDYQVEPFSVLSIGGKPAIEVSFMLPLFTCKGIPVFWTGRIDLLTRWRDAARPSHMDHKTSQMLGERFYSDFRNDQAQLGYAWAVRELTGETPAGYCVNALGCRRPTRTGVMFEFERRRYEVDADRLDEWKENTCHIVEDLLDTYEKGRFPMETKWCSGKYGPCPYSEVCVLPRSSRNVILHSGMYKDVTWSPLHREDVTV